MTSSAWATATDPLAMLSFLRGRGPVSERKLRLFAAACCRRVWPLLGEADRRAVEVVERYADRRATAADLAGAARVATGPGGHAAARRLGRSGGVVAAAAAELAGSDAYARVRDAFGVSGPPDLGAVATALDIPVVVASDPRDAYLWCEGREQVGQAAILRDIFDHLKPDSFNPPLRTEAVVALARHIYEERVWERMPALADALVDAGCADPDVLGHLRGPWPHARGCWVVDLVLGGGESGRGR